MSKKYTSIFFGALILDRLSKWWVLTNLQERTIALFPGLNLSLTWNRGVSWGLFSNATSLGFYFLTIVIAFVIISFSIYTIYEYKRGTLIAFELLVLAGAMSNFFDRIYYGAVIDFIDLYCPSGGYGWHWPMFNVADACIVVGIGGVIVKGFLCERQKK